MFVKYSLKVFAMFSGSVISCSPSLMIQGSRFIPWTHFTQMRPQLPWIVGVLFDDPLVEGRVC